MSRTPRISRTPGLSRTSRMSGTSRTSTSRISLGLLAAASLTFISALTVDARPAAAPPPPTIWVPHSSQPHRDEWDPQAEPPIQTPEQPTPPPITDGPTLFTLRGCAQCHQIHGAGGHKGPTLDGVGRRLKPEAIHKQIFEGSDAMPAFGEALPPEEIDALTRYLHTLRAKSSRPAKAPIPAPAPSE